MNLIKSAYRMMHIDMIPYTLKCGFVNKMSNNACPTYIQIGDPTLINSRSEFTVPGTALSLDDFIPFYFGPRSPMLYVIQHGNQNVVKRKPSEIVYCVIMIDDVIRNNLSGYFTDGHARNAFTRFYPNSQLVNLSKIVSYDDVYSKDWGLTADNTGETKRRKSAELLLEDEVPPQYIRYFVVYDEDAKRKLIGFGVKADIIYVRPDFYY